MFRLTHSIAALVFAIFSSDSLARPALYQWLPTEDLTLPAASITLANNKRHLLSEFKGNVVVLNLWATWCAPCLEELPTLDALEKDLAKEGLVVVPLSLDRDTSVKKLRIFMDNREVALGHLAHDPSGSFGYLSARGLPVTYLIDRKGKLRYQFHGATDWTDEAPQQKIRELLAEQP